MDKTLIYQHYQGFELHEETETGRLYWLGSLSFRSNYGKIYTFRIRLVYPRDYPNKLPIVFDEDKIFPPCLDRHILNDHSFCLTLPDKKELDLAEKENIVDFLEVVRSFLEKQVIYDSIGRWPGLDEPHGNMAIVKYYLELEMETEEDFPGKERLIEHLLSGKKCGRNDKCPCGSGKKYKKCHEYLLSRLRTKLQNRF